MGFKYSMDDSKSESVEMRKTRILMNKLKTSVKGFNCQKYTAAFELMNRGIVPNITASNSPYDRVFDIPVGCKSPVANWCLNRNVEFIKLPSKDFLEFINSTMVGYGKSARGMIGVKWKEEKSGHIFNLCVIDGVTHMVDAMYRRIRSLLDPDIYLRKWVDPIASLGFFRIDNLSIDKDLETDTFDTVSKIFDIDDRKTARYTSISELLVHHGEKGKVIKIFRNHKCIGSLKVGKALYSESRDKKYVWWDYSWV